MQRQVLAAFLIASLTACQAEQSSEPATPDSSETAARVAETSSPPTAPGGNPQDAPAPASSAASDSDCGADKVAGRWLNALPSADAKAAIAAAAGERTFRYYTQGDAITMDFSPARLNVEIGADGRIKRFWCG
jgi:hypothetical protein